MAQELECKIPIEDCVAMAEKILALGGIDEGQVFERNWVFDTPQRSLLADKKLLRLRTVDNMPGGLVTVKGVPVHAKFKSREEIEYRVDDIEAFARSLLTLGYERSWYYEKRRWTWSYLGCEVMLDDLPCLGAFIEVEAVRDEMIRGVLENLGVNPEDHTPLSYRGLYEKFCTEHHIAMGSLRYAGSAGSAILTPDQAVHPGFAGMQPKSVQSSGADTPDKKS